MSSPPFPQIIGTLGTTTDDPAVLSALAEAGMGMARINTAYARKSEIEERIVRCTAATGLPIMLDLKGRQIRVDCTTTRQDPSTGQSIERPCRYPIAAGELIRVGFGAVSGLPVRFNLDFEGDLETGDLVTFDNGTIRTRMIDPRAHGIEPLPHAVLLEVIDAGGGQMNPQMGANVPGKRLSLPSLSERDALMVAQGVARGVPCYALSFVQSGADLLQLHQALLAHGDAVASLVAKIEEPVGIAALEEIVETGRRTGRDIAVMVARGDLFVELPREQLPEVQRDLLMRCRALAAPSIVATGLLMSMTDSPTPARSEVCDVAAALSQGASALMLSDETSNSRHPVAAVQFLATMWARCGGSP